jgi:hypothetical protein
MTSYSKRLIMMNNSLLVLSFTSFGGLIEQPWSYDDKPAVEKTALVATDPLEIFNPNSREPLRFVSHLYFLLMYIITPAGPASFHAGNIVLHLVNALLLVRVVGKTFDTRLALSGGILFFTSTVGFETIYSVAESATLFGRSLAPLAGDRVLI